ncbi:MAG: hypothetical protein EP343_00625 [Deltaproteobacteria bacterium]|nr:MAG: hypothetical protein EP343_00625 [Deltaproteobacteria bacterium]
MKSNAKNVAFLHSILENHDDWCKLFYERFKDSIESHGYVLGPARKYLDLIGERSALQRKTFLAWVVCQAWFDRTKERERRKIQIRYIPEQSSELREQAYELGELFLLAREYLRVHQTELSRSKQVEHAILLAREWRTFESVPCDLSSGEVGSVCFSKEMLKLWIRRCVEVVKNLTNQTLANQTLVQTADPQELEQQDQEHSGSVVFTSSILEPEEAVQRRETNRWQRSVLEAVFRDSVDARLFELKLNEETEKSIAKTLSLEGRQVLRRWNQLMERARFLSNTYLQEAIFFQEAYAAFGSQMELLKSSLLERLQSSFLNTTEREIASAFWLSIHSLAKIIQSQDSKTWKGVTGDWKRSIQKAEPQKLRRDLVFYWNWLCRTQCSNSPYR